jgi:hypothetical protein
MTNKLIQKMSKKHDLEVVYYEGKSRKISFINNNGKLINKKIYKYENLLGEIFIKMNRALTLKNFNDYIPSGNYIFGIRGHVLSVKNGTIQDWKELQDESGVINRIWAEKHPKKIDDEEIDYSSLC